MSSDDMDQGRGGNRSSDNARTLGMALDQHLRVVTGHAESFFADHHNWRAVGVMGLDS